MTSFKKAWDAFSESDEFHESTDPLSIGAPGHQRVYLENRINRAFAAGWNAAMLERRFPDTSTGNET